MVERPDNDRITIPDPIPDYKREKVELDISYVEEFKRIKRREYSTEKSTQELDDFKKKNSNKKK